MGHKESHSFQRGRAPTDRTEIQCLFAINKGTSRGQPWSLTGVAETVFKRICCSCFLSESFLVLVMDSKSSQTNQSSHFLFNILLSQTGRQHWAWKQVISYIKSWSYGLWNQSGLGSAVLYFILTDARDMESEKEISLLQTLLFFFLICIKCIGVTWVNRVI